MHRDDRRGGPGRPDRPAAAVVLAAVDRATRHRAGAPSGAPAGSILEHLALGRRSGASRAVRARLQELELEGTVERRLRHGLAVWSLTGKGLRRLERDARAGEAPALPESPQHRRWRNARTAAALEIDRLRGSLEEALADAERLLATERPHSDAWFELAETLRRTARRVGSAGHCLYEWPEPDDARADIDDRREPEDRCQQPPLRRRRRALRAGRRNIALWRDAAGPR